MAALFATLSRAVPSPAEGASTNLPARFLGAASCSSSSCHGGGGQGQNQFQVWSLRDVHCSRPYATLTTARARQIGAALGMKDPSAEIRCTSCHAPLQSVPAVRRGPDFKASEGVSCESCHGPAEPWLRAHTRPDYFHAARTAAGMRDLKNQYVRANTCIACHQTVEIPLLKAGHPELIFELDGQAVSEPKHWRESTNWSGAQVWLVGQAVALREISWQVNTNNPFDEKLTARWQASLWLMRKMSVLLSAEGAPLFSAPDKADAVCKDADKLARDFAGMLWTAELSHKVLGRLAATGTDFQESGVPAASQARRAERLVLGLDRLAEELELKSKNSKADAALERLFGLAQSIPDFDPRKFSLALQEFSAALNEK